MKKMTFLKIKASIIASIFVFCNARATIWPKDSSLVHYTTVYFQEDFYKGAKTYTLVLSKDSLFQNLIGAKKNTVSLLPAFCINELEWGQVYFWKVIAFNTAARKINSGKVHKFKICTIETRYFDEVKLTIQSNLPAKHSADFIAIDNTRTIFNRKGQAVWTLPLIEGLVNESTEVRDLKMTQENTITFLAAGIPLEIDFEGRVLWKGLNPFVLNKDTITFHHDFKKDREGNYFVLGNKLAYRKLLIHLPEDVVKNEDMVRITDSAVYRKTQIGLLLKFDRNNKLLWYWDADTYLQDVDLNHRKSMSGFPNFNTHANAFSLNKEGTIAYIGFRDLSRIVKLDLITKKVIASYGEKFPSGEAKLCNNVFKSQHGANLTNHKTILVLNNNGDRSGGLSSVIEFKESPEVGDSEVVWRLGLDFDRLTKGKSLKGGNVIEMKNTNLFVCAGELNRIFEVTRSKEIVWDAFVYSRGKGDTLWQAFPQYRANVFDKLVYYHFLAQIEAIKNVENRTIISYSIYNTGNFSDSYYSEVIDENGNRVGENKSAKIEKGLNLKTTQNISGKNNGKLILRISSKGSSRVEMLKIN